MPQSRMRSAACGGLLQLSLAMALGAAGTRPANALVILDQIAVASAAEFDTSGAIRRDDHADTNAGGPANASVQLGNGTNAFNEPTSAQAFGVFHDNQATYWVDVNADNTVPDNRGIGAAGVILTYTAVKQHGDTSFTLHTTGGLLRLEDPDAGNIPLSALVELDAFVLHGQDVLKHVSAQASLFGNGRSLTSPILGAGAFSLQSNGFDIRPGDFVIDTDLDDRNEVGAELQLRPLNIPVDLSNIVDDTPITIEVTLNGEARAPGAETIALAFFRDPISAGGGDPLAGASTITFEAATSQPGSPVDAPEPQTATLLGSALLATWIMARRRSGTRA